MDVNRSVDDSILDLQDVHQDMKTAMDALKQSYIKTLNIRTSQGETCIDVCAILIKEVDGLVCKEWF